MSVLLNGELVLYGFVGENFWGEGFTSFEVLEALTELGREADITVRINSGGGYVDDGIAIFNALKAHKGKVTVIVDAMAASSASVIAMAGDDRIMRTGAMMMIHEPSSSIWGTAADIEQFAKVVEKQAENLASIYAEVTGDDIADVRADMKSELWLNADEAVERGYATAIENKKARVAAAHDYSIYAHAPERFVALSARKLWNCTQLSKSAAAIASAKPSIEKDKPAMTTQPVAEPVAADTNKLVADAVAKALADSKARLKAIMTNDEAKGREALAEHFAHETDMPVEAVIAALKVAPKTEASDPAQPSPAPAPAPAATYEQQRVAAANLAMPGGGPTAAAGAPKINRDAIFAARRNTQKGA
ncbi:Clp protease ClpP [Rhizobium cremeum]|uniref:head maturation protease, ClpP-related n=1 Tax=Rhizobium cremeum TaxID=2813827 RepID=UPI001FD4663E|nr:head maturation protease, ClpP-related [Rhizobium cremeum]MCJ7996682.1 Clp protease ClpP [Rhizobium cremeum]MCJ7999406.1 Clp protease ClpP [Rhizobium cremeum]